MRSAPWRARDLAQSLQKAGRRLNASHVAHDGLDDDRSDTVRVCFKSPRDGLHRIERQGDRGIRKALGNPSRVRQPQRRHAGARLYQQRIHMPVVAALELHREVPPGESARQPYGAHGGFGPGVDQAHQFHGRHCVPDGFGQFGLSFRRGAEAGAAGQRVLDRPDDIGMPVTQEQRPPGANVVDVLVAVGVPDARSLATDDKRRRASHAAESAHWRVHAAGNGFLRPGEQSLRLRSVHSEFYASPGTTLLSRKLMTVSCSVPCRLRSSRALRSRYPWVPAKRSWTTS